METSVQEVSATSVGEHALMRIRDGTADDLRRLEALPKAEHWERHVGHLRRALGSRHSLVVETDDRVVGMAVWDRDFFGKAFIWMLGVHPLYHRRGIASALIRKVESLCKKESLFTSTNRSNLAMQALCNKLGFVESGILQNLDPGDPEIFFHKTP
jgi:ribosomal protein S18 acetylase RimI-like enzyme